MCSWVALDPLNMGKGDIRFQNHFIRTASNGINISVQHELEKHVFTNKEKEEAEKRRKARLLAQQEEQAGVPLEFRSSQLSKYYRAHGLQRAKGGGKITGLGTAAVKRDPLKAFLNESTCSLSRIWVSMRVMI